MAWSGDMMVELWSIAVVSRDARVLLNRASGVSDAARPPAGLRRELRLRYARENIGEFLHGAQYGVSQKGRGYRRSEGPLSLAG